MRTAAWEMLVEEVNWKVFATFRLPQRGRIQRSHGNTLYWEFDQVAYRDTLIAVPLWQGHQRVDRSYLTRVVSQRPTSG